MLLQTFAFHKAAPMKSAINVEFQFFEFVALILHRACVLIIFHITVLGIAPCHVMLSDIPLSLNPDDIAKWKRYIPVINLISSVHQWSWWGDPLPLQSPKSWALKLLFIDLLKLFTSTPSNTSPRMEFLPLTWEARTAGSVLCIWACS